MNKIIYKIECERTNVTPKAFFNYCVKQAALKGASMDSWTTYEDWANNENNIPYNITLHDDWDEPQTEIYEYMPYKIQIYLQGAYNFNLEFDFDNEKKGSGYFYLTEAER